MLLLKFLALWLIKPLPTSIIQTILELEVDSPDRSPSSGNGKAKLLPRWEHFKRDWRGALKDSWRALRHRHLFVRFFTNVCETLVQIILLSRWLYGWVRRRTSTSYRMLSVPHSTEPDHFNDVRDGSLSCLVKESALWIWNSVKVWQSGACPAHYTVQPMRKVPGWMVVMFDGWAYAVKIEDPKKLPWRKRFRRPFGTTVLMITRPTADSFGIYLAGRKDVPFTDEEIVRK